MVMGIPGGEWVCRFRGLSGFGLKLRIGKLRGRRGELILFAAVVAAVPVLLLSAEGGVCMGIWRAACMLS